VAAQHKHKTLADKPTIYVVCSDRHRNGKTLLARVLVDYLMLDGKDPFVIDANVPEGPLRAAFPGRTALVDFEQVQGQMKLFDTIVDSLGRDYVIDLPAPQTENFFATLKQLNFLAEATRLGFQFVVLFIVDKELASLNAADDIAASLAPYMLVKLRNLHVGSSVRTLDSGLTIDIPILDRDIFPLVEDKRFSYRAFLLGDETLLPARQVTKLKVFLLALITGLQNIEPELSLRRLKDH
jgi:hypothetical protein